jgi:protein phosphatase
MSGSCPGALAVDTVFGAYSSLFATILPEEVDSIGGQLPLPQFQPAIVSAVLDEALEAFRGNPAVINVANPVAIVGDLHGNFHDLIRIFALVRDPLQHRFLFLGDYVDRGQYSFDVLLLLIAFALKFPENCFLIRGNHEFRQVNSEYGFLAEMFERFGDDVLWQRCQTVFGYLPLAAIVGGAIFCVHGGIGPNVVSVAAVQSRALPIDDDSDDRMVAELVWSDPTANTAGYVESRRGKGVQFGEGALRKFLDDSKISCLMRGHEWGMQGVREFPKGMCVTVFSSSDYCGRGNCGGFVTINEALRLSRFTFEPRPVRARKAARFIDVELKKPRPPSALLSLAIPQKKVSLRTAWAKSTFALRSGRLAELKRPPMGTIQRACNIEWEGVRELVTEPEANPEEWQIPDEWKGYRSQRAVSLDSARRTDLE